MSAGVTQAAISALSLISIGFAYWPGRDLRLYGALAGFAAQPCWLYLIISQELWGLAPLTPAYATMYILALRAHWRKV